VDQRIDRVTDCNVIVNRIGKVQIRPCIDGRKNEILALSVNA